MHKRMQSIDCIPMGPDIFLYTAWSECTARLASYHHSAGWMDGYVVIGWIVDSWTNHLFAGQGGEVHLSALWLE